MNDGVVRRADSLLLKRHLAELLVEVGETVCCLGLIVHEELVARVRVHSAQLVLIRVQESVGSEVGHSVLFSNLEVLVRSVESCNVSDQLLDELRIFLLVLELIR